MINQYSHDLITSLILWLDNRIVAGNQGYINITGSLYRQQNDQVNGVSYISPFRSWVYDSCASGAYIPNGFYNNSGQLLTRESGIVIDFINGQVICPQDWGDQLSGVYARKQINLYFSSLSEVDYVLEQIYNTNKNLQYPITGFQGNVLAAPLVMITNARENNVPWALGGEQRSDNRIQAFIISNSNYLQEGINSICTDSSYKTIPFVGSDMTPIAASGDLKAGTYNYCTGIFEAIGCENGIWIQSVYVNKISERINKNTTFYVSTADFDLQKARFVA